MRSRKSFVQKSTTHFCKVPLALGWNFMLHDGTSSWSSSIPKVLLGTALVHASDRCATPQQTVVNYSSQISEMALTCSTRLLEYGHHPRSIPVNDMSDTPVMSVSNVSSNAGISVGIAINDTSAFVDIEDRFSIFRPRICRSSVQRSISSRLDTRHPLY